MNDIKTLIKEAYSTAKSKGWHDPEPSFEETIANIHGELGECWQQWRYNHGLNEIYYSISDKSIIPNGSINDDIKPEGIPIELADVCIRIFDYFGSDGVDNPEMIYCQIFQPGNAETIAGIINICHAHLDKALQYHGKGNRTGDHLISVIHEIEWFCEKNGIELDKAIDIKMKYNRGRSWRHNGKRV